LTAVAKRFAALFGGVLDGDGVVQQINGSASRQLPPGDRDGALERQVALVVVAQLEQAVVVPALLDVGQRDPLAGAPVAAQRVRRGALRIEQSFFSYPLQLWPFTR
jgi:hypothetical protein